MFDTCVQRFDVTENLKNFRTKSLFGTAQNSFMGNFFCQTLISKTTLWMNLFLFSSHKEMSWDELKKVV